MPYTRRSPLSLRTLKQPATRQPAMKGGAGSGNFGHAGRPGQVGGSAPDVTAKGNDKASKRRYKDALLAMGSMDAVPYVVRWRKVSEAALESGVSYADAISIATDVFGVENVDLGGPSIRAGVLRAMAKETEKPIEIDEYTFWLDAHEASTPAPDLVVFKGTPSVSGYFQFRSRYRAINPDHLIVKERIERKAELIALADAIERDGYTFESLISEAKNSGVPATPGMLRPLIDKESISISGVMRHVGDGAVDEACAMTVLADTAKHTTAGEMLEEFSGLTELAAPINLWPPLVAAASNLDFANSDPGDIEPLIRRVYEFSREGGAKSPEIRKAFGESGDPGVAAAFENVWRSYEGKTFGVGTQSIDAVTGELVMADEAQFTFASEYLGIAKPTWKEEKGAARDWKDTVVTNLSESAGDGYSETSDLVRQWAYTSNKYPLSMRLQEIAAQMFDTDLSEWQSDLHAESREKIDAIDKATTERARRFLRDMYDHTQEWFKERGITHLRAYRGVISPMDSSVKEGDVIRYGDNALASWSIDPSVAARFGGLFVPDFATGPIRGHVLEAAIPVENIMSTPFTGFGCLDEFEVVVIGSKGPAHAIVHFSESKDLLTGTAFFKALAMKGGAGSGNFGHAGRPGKRGGSAPDNQAGASDEFSPKSSREARWNEVLDRVAAQVRDDPAIKQVVDSGSVYDAAMRDGYTLAAWYKKRAGTTIELFDVDFLKSALLTRLTPTEAVPIIAKISADYPDSSPLPESELSAAFMNWYVSPNLDGLADLAMVVQSNTGYMYADAMRKAVANAASTGMTPDEIKAHFHSTGAPKVLNDLVAVDFDNWAVLLGAQHPDEVMALYRKKANVSYKDIGEALGRSAVRAGMSFGDTLKLATDGMGAEIIDENYAAVRLSIVKGMLDNSKGPLVVDEETYWTAAQWSKATELSDRIQTERPPTIDGYMQYQAAKSRGGWAAQGAALQFALQDAQARDGYSFDDLLRVAEKYEVSPPISLLSQIISEDKTTFTEIANAMSAGRISAMGGLTSLKHAAPHSTAGDLLEVMPELLRIGNESKWKGGETIPRMIARAVGSLDTERSDAQEVRQLVEDTYERLRGASVSASEAKSAFVVGGNPQVVAIVEGAIRPIEMKMFGVGTQSVDAATGERREVTADQFDLVEEFNAIANSGSSSEVAGDWKNKVVTGLAERAGVEYSTANTLVRQWANTSNDHVLSMQVQGLAVNLFGANLSDWQAEMYAGFEEEIDTISDEYDDGVRNLLQVMYDGTQAWFKKRGVTHIRLYRGQVTADVPGGTQSGDAIQFNDNALASWSASSAVAQRFAHMRDSAESDDARPHVLEAIVPVERILGTPFTGFGCLEELEMVVIGSSEPAHAIVHFPYDEMADSAYFKALAIKGGPGSGNFDHDGRPGLVGGSAPSDGIPNAPDPQQDAMNRRDAERSLLSQHYKGKKFKTVGRATHYRGMTGAAIAKIRVKDSRGSRFIHLDIESGEVWESPVRGKDKSQLKPLGKYSGDAASNAAIVNKLAGEKPAAVPAPVVPKPMPAPKAPAQLVSEMTGEKPAAAPAPVAPKPMPAPKAPAPMPAPIAEPVKPTPVAAPAPMKPIEDRPAAPMMSLDEVFSLGDRATDQQISGAVGLWLSGNRGSGKYDPENLVKDLHAVMPDKSAKLTAIQSRVALEMLRQRGGDVNVGGLCRIPQALIDGHDRPEEWASYVNGALHQAGYSGESLRRFARMYSNLSLTSTRHEEVIKSMIGTSRNLEQHLAWLDYYPPVFGRGVSEAIVDRAVRDGMSFREMSRAVMNEYTSRRDYSNVVKIAIERGMTGVDVGDAYISLALAGGLDEYGEPSPRIRKQAGDKLFDMAASVKPTADDWVDWYGRVGVTPLTDKSVLSSRVTEILQDAAPRDAREFIGFLERSSAKLGGIVPLDQNVMPSKMFDGITMPEALKIMALGSGSPTAFFENTNHLYRESNYTWDDIAPYVPAALNDGQIIEDTMFTPDRAAILNRIAYDIGDDAIPDAIAYQAFVSYAGNTLNVFGTRHEDSLSLPPAARKLIPFLLKAAAFHNNGLVNSRTGQTIESGRVSSAPIVDIAKWDGGLGPNGHSDGKHTVVLNLANSIGGKYAYENMDELIRQWARTSNGDSPDSYAIQESAARVFDAELTQWQKNNAGTVGTRISVFGEEMSQKQAAAMMDSANRSIYEATQAHFKKKGISYVRLYRGVNNSELGAKIRAGDTVQIKENALSSWSTDVRVAEGFGGTIFEAIVPVADIFSTPYTGYGCANEQEAIVIGRAQPMHVRVVKSQYHAFAAPSATKSWDAQKHPRHAAGSPEGGRFAPAGDGTTEAGEPSKLDKILDNIMAKNGVDRLGAHLDVIELKPEWAEIDNYTTDLVRVFMKYGVTDYSEARKRLMDRDIPVVAEFLGAAVDAGFTNLGTENIIEAVLNASRPARVSGKEYTLDQIAEGVDGIPPIPEFARDAIKNATWRDVMKYGEILAKSRYGFAYGSGSSAVLSAIVKNMAKPATVAELNEMIDAVEALGPFSDPFMMRELPAKSLLNAIDFRSLVRSYADKGIDVETILHAYSVGENASVSSPDDLSFASDWDNLSWDMLDAYPEALNPGGVVGGMFGDKLKITDMPESLAHYIVGEHYEDADSMYSDVTRAFGRSKEVLDAINTVTAKAYAFEEMGLPDHNTGEDALIPNNEKWLKRFSARKDSEGEAKKQKHEIVGPLGFEVLRPIAGDTEYVGEGREPYDFANELIGQWARTSNSDPRSISIQEAVAAEFGVALSDYQKRLAADPDQQSHGEKDYILHEDHAVEVERMRKAVRWMYDQTQEKFKKAKVGSLRLFRGVATIDGINPNALDPGDVFRYTDNAASSWSTDYEIAAKFGGAMIIEAVVPVENVLCTARTGFGCLNEQEVIVLGKPEGEVSYARKARWPLPAERPYFTKSLAMKGGAGSGNFGHAGRPGEVGGSAPSATPLLRQMDGAIGGGVSLANSLVTAMTGATPSASLPASMPEQIVATLTAEPVASGRAGWEASFGVGEFSVDANTGSPVPTNSRQMAVAEAFRHEIEEDSSGASWKNTVVKAIMADTGLSYDEINAFVQSWASNSNWGASIVTQQVAAELFGIDTSEWQKGQIASWFRKIPPGSDMDRSVFPLGQDHAGRIAEQSLRAMYERTQAWFKERGVTHVRLYRGATLPESVSSAAHGDTIRYDDNALESWTLDPLIASRFASGQVIKWAGEAKPVAIIETTVPVERIASMPFTGLGCLSELECLVIGGNSPSHAKIYTENVTKRPETAAVQLPGYDYFSGKQAFVKGGAGSGNHGHAGRPGEVGGSAPDTVRVRSDESSATLRHDPERVTAMLEHDDPFMLNDAYAGDPDVTMADVFAWFSAKGDPSDMRRLTNMKYDMEAMCIEGRSLIAKTFENAPMTVDDLVSLLKAYPDVADGAPWVFTGELVSHLSGDLSIEDIDRVRDAAGIINRFNLSDGFNAKTIANAAVRSGFGFSDVLDWYYRNGGRDYDLGYWWARDVASYMSDAGTTLTPDELGWLFKRAVGRDAVMYFERNDAVARETKRLSPSAMMPSVDSATGEPVAIDEWVDDTFKRIGLDGIASQEIAAGNKDAVAAALSQTAQTTYDEANVFVGTWAVTSNGHVPWHFGMQRVASDVFGVIPSEFQQALIAQNVARRQGKDDPNLNADYVFEPGTRFQYGEGYYQGGLSKEQAKNTTERLVRATYANTQKWLKDRGVTELRLFRGSEIPALADAEAGDVVQYDDNVLASWSLEPYTATRFAGTGTAGVVLSAVIPAERVFSIPLTGPGCTAEHEVIVIGSNDPSYGYVYRRAGKTAGKAEIGNSGKSLAMKGGPGSGNFGHAGRPGEVGGSAPDNIGAAAPAENDEKAKRRQKDKERTDGVLDAMQLNPTPKNFDRLAHYAVTRAGEVARWQEIGESFDGMLDATRGLPADFVVGMIKEMDAVSWKDLDRGIYRVASGKTNRYNHGNYFQNRDKITGDPIKLLPSTSEWFSPEAKQAVDAYFKAESAARQERIDSVVESLSSKLLKNADRASGMVRADDLNETIDAVLRDVHKGTLKRSEGIEIGLKVLDRTDGYKAAVNQLWRHRSGGYWQDDAIFVGLPKLYDDWLFEEGAQQYGHPLRHMQEIGVDWTRAINPAAMLYWNGGRDADTYTGEVNENPYVMGGERLNDKRSVVFFELGQPSLERAIEDQVFAQIDQRRFWSLLMTQGGIKNAPDWLRIDMTMTNANYQPMDLYRQGVSALGTVLQAAKQYEGVTSDQLLADGTIEKLLMNKRRPLQPAKKITVAKDTITVGALPGFAAERPGDAKNLLQDVYRTLPDHAKDGTSGEYANERYTTLADLTPAQIDKVVDLSGISPNSPLALDLFQFLRSKEIGADGKPLSGDSGQFKTNLPANHVQRLFADFLRESPYQQAQPVPKSHPSAMSAPSVAGTGTLHDTTQAYKWFTKGKGKTPSFDTDKKLPHFGQREIEGAKADVATNLSNAMAGIDEARELGISPSDTSALIHRWAETSNQTLAAITVQDAMAKTFGPMFGTHLSEWQKSRLDDLSARRETMDREGKSLNQLDTWGRRSYSYPFERFSDSPNPEPQPELSTDRPIDKEASLRLTADAVGAIYQRTQKELKALGVKEVVLYRGVRLPRPAPVYPGDTVSTESNAVESWTLDQRVARQFASDNSDSNAWVGVVLKASVPVERIFSTARTGFGCLNEGEFLVLNSNLEDQARIDFMVSGKAKITNPKTAGAQALSSPNVEPQNAPKKKKK